MPYYRKRRNYRKRKPMTRNRRYRKKFTRSGALGNKNQRVFYYKRFVSLSSFLAGADGADKIQTYTFKLDDMASVTDFTNLYDAYKINAVKVTCLPAFTATNFEQLSGSSSIFTSGITPANMRIYSCMDYNGSAPTTIAGIREYANCKVTQYTKGHRRYLKPRVNIDANADSLAAQFGRKPWLNARSDDLVHYGLTIGIDTSTLPATAIAASDVLLKIEAVYYVSFKAVS